MVEIYVQQALSQPFHALSSLNQASPRPCFIFPIKCCFSSYQMLPLFHNNHQNFFYLTIEKPIISKLPAFIIVYYISLICLVIYLWIKYNVSNFHIRLYLLSSSWGSLIPLYSPYLTIIKHKRYKKIAWHLITYFRCAFMKANVI